MRRFLRPLTGAQLIQIAGPPLHHPPAQVHQHSSPMTRHDRSPFIGGFHTVLVEELGDRIERDIQQPGDAPGGDIATPQPLPDNFDEGLGKEGRQRACPVLAAIVA